MCLIIHNGSTVCLFRLWRLMRAALGDKALLGNSSSYSKFPIGSRLQKEFAWNTAMDLCPGIHLSLLLFDKRQQINKKIMLRIAATLNNKSNSHVWI